MNKTIIKKTIDVINRTTIDERESLKYISEKIQSKMKFGITYLNQNSLNHFIADNDYRHAMDNMEVFMDGIGAYFMMKIFNRTPQLPPGTEIFNKLLFELIRNKIPVVLIGGNFIKPEIETLSIKNNIQLVEYINGYENIKSILDQMRRLDLPEYFVVSLGMGTPKQEMAAARILENFSNCGVICVGKFWEYFFEFAKRPPKLTTKMGLEWLFRLLYQPKIYWRRYLIGIPLFVYHVISLKIAQR